MNKTQLEKFAAQYTAAWCSQNAARESKGHFDEVDYARQLNA